jgi:uncharacterized protein YkwD
MTIFEPTETLVAQVEERLANHYKVEEHATGPKLADTVPLKADARLAKTARSRAGSMSTL